MLIYLFVLIFALDTCVWSGNIQPCIESYSQTQFYDPNKVQVKKALHPRANRMNFHNQCSVQAISEIWMIDRLWEQAYCEWLETGKQFWWWIFSSTCYNPSSVFEICIWVKLRDRKKAERDSHCFLPEEQSKTGNSLSERNPPMYQVHLVFSNYLLANYFIPLCSAAAEDDDDCYDENDGVFCTAAAILSFESDVIVKHSLKMNCDHFIS